MNRARAILLAAAVALPLLALPAAAEHDGAVPLSAVTRLEASRSGTVDVVLHRDARVTTAGKDLGVRFQGRGRLLALWLERDTGFGDYLSSYRLPAFAGGEQITYGSAPPAKCTSTPSSTVPIHTECEAQEPEALLHAGRYRLTVLTDGQPVRVTLRLRGLSAGSTTVRPHRLLASTQKSLPVRENAEAVVTFSDTADLGAPADAVVVARAKATTAAAAVRGASVCRRDVKGPTPPLAYAASCPGGTAGAYSYTVQAGGQSYGLLGAFATSSSDEHEGPVGLGGSFTDSSGVQLEQALGVWLARP